MNDPLPPMRFMTTTVVTLDARVLGAWNHEKVEKLREVLHLRAKADETCWYPCELTITFEGVDQKEAAQRVAAALKEMK